MCWLGLRSPTCMYVSMSHDSWHVLECVDRCSKSTMYVWYCMTCLCLCLILPPCLNSTCLDFSTLKSKHNVTLNHEYLDLGHNINDSFPPFKWFLCSHEMAPVLAPSGWHISRTNQRRLCIDLNSLSIFGPCLWRNYLEWYLYY